VFLLKILVFHILIKHIFGAQEEAPSHRVVHCAVGRGDVDLFIL
jgi:hypothetical protein